MKGNKKNAILGSPIPKIYGMHLPQLPSIVEEYSQENTIIIMIIIINCCCCLKIYLFGILLFSAHNPSPTPQIIGIQLP